MKSDCLSSVPGAAIRNCGQAPQKANVLSPTHSPHPTPRAPRGWRSSHATHQSSREALPRVAAYWGRGSCYLGAPGWGGSRHGPGISTDAEPSSWSQSPPGPRRTRTPTSAPIPSHPVMGTCAQSRADSSQERRGSTWGVTELLREKRAQRAAPSGCLVADSHSLPPSATRVQLRRP